MFRKNRIFAEAFNDYYALVFSTVYSKVNNLDDAEDICQEVFIQFYKKIDVIEDKQKWLHGALRLEVLSYYRKKKHSQIDIEDVFYDKALSFINGARDVRVIIEEALTDEENFNDNREKILFDLIALRNFTYEEAAAQVGFSRRQARYRYGIIVKRILDYLSRKGLSNLEDLL